MTRKKVNLAWIVNDAARRASLKKRRASLLKKVGELSILCGVRACIVIYSPDEVEPAVWPSASAVTELLLEFRNLPELDRTKKMMDQESYLKDRLLRVQSQLRKQQRKNKEMEMNQIMDQILVQGRALDGLGLREADGVAWWIDEKRKEIRKRVQYSHHQVPPPPPPLPNSVMAAVAPQVAVVEGGMTGVDQWMWDDWFSEILQNPNENGGVGNCGGAGNDMGVIPVLPSQASNGGGSRGSVVVNELGLPFDVYKSWPNIFSP